MSCVEKFCRNLRDPVESDVESVSIIGKRIEKCGRKATGLRTIDVYDGRVAAR